MKEVTYEKIELKTALQPETETERQLLCEPEFIKGLYWGVPRYGHPEGKIYKHIREVLLNIDQLNVDVHKRSSLRLIAFAHDTFKFMEDKSRPRDWTKHHGVYARRFMEQYTKNQAVLDIIELHDEAYYAWRLKTLYHQPEKGELRLQNLIKRLDSNLQLYYLFFKCDTNTGDKNRAPLKWLEKILKLMH